MQVAGRDPDLLDPADDASGDEPVVASMEIDEFGGPKTAARRARSS